MPIKKKTCFIRVTKPKLNYMFYIIDTSNDSESLKIKMGDMHMKKMKTGKKKIGIIILLLERMSLGKKHWY